MSGRARVGRVMRLLVLALAALAVVASAAVKGNPMRPVDTERLSIDPTRPMLAQKLARPLYIVLDPERVPDEYTIPEQTIKEIRILAIRTFVRRDVRHALLSLFDSVDVVAPSWPIPPGALVADVEIQRFSTEVDMATGGGYHAGRIYGQMGWAFAIKRPGERQYAFSYADTVTGAFALTDVSQTPEMMESTYRRALERLLAELVNGKALELLDAPPGAPAP